MGYGVVSFHADRIAVHWWSFALSLLLGSYNPARGALKVTKVDEIAQHVKGGGS